MPATPGGSKKSKKSHTPKSPKSAKVARAERDSKRASAQSSSSTGADMSRATVEDEIIQEAGEEVISNRTSSSTPAVNPDTRLREPGPDLLLVIPGREADTASQKAATNREFRISYRSKRESCNDSTSTDRRSK